MLQCVSVCGSVCPTEQVWVCITAHARIGKVEEYKVNMNMFAVASAFEAHMLRRMQRMVSVSRRLGGRETDRVCGNKSRCNKRSSQLANFNSHFNVSQIMLAECSRPSVKLPENVGAL